VAKVERTDGGAGLEVTQWGGSMRTASSAMFGAAELLVIA
jgi:hypothetical protein